MSLKERSKKETRNLTGKTPKPKVIKETYEYWQSRKLNGSQYKKRKTGASNNSNVTGEDTVIYRYCL